MIRNIALAEARATARRLDQEAKDCCRNCTECRPGAPCREGRDIRAELAEIRHDIAHWFDPGPDQDSLWP